MGKEGKIAYFLINDERKKWAQICARARVFSCALACGLGPWNWLRSRSSLVSARSERRSLKLWFFLRCFPLFFALFSNFSVFFRKVFWKLTRKKIQRSSASHFLPIHQIRRRIHLLYLDVSKLRRHRGFYLYRPVAVWRPQNGDLSITAFVDWARGALDLPWFLKTF